MTACASMTDSGRLVETVSAREVYGMEFVGNVATSSPLAGVAFQHVSYQNAMNKALNQAAAMGATHLVLDEGTSSRFWGVNQSVRGKAYRRK
jgi:hypothetical protein